MKKKLFLLTFLLLLFGGALWWGCRSGEDISQYIPAEVPVPEENDRALSSIRRRITDAGKRGDFRSLEKLFTLSRAERELAKHESNRDPVSEQLSLLRDHVSTVKADQWQIFTLEKNSAIRILRASTADGRSLSIVLVKRKNGYRISSVKLG